jgi:hypothetical protein
MHVDTMHLMIYDRRVYGLGRIGRKLHVGMLAKTIVASTTGVGLGDGVCMPLVIWLSGYQLAWMWTCCIQVVA